jgi:hypothetical protein
MIVLGLVPVRGQLLPASVRLAALEPVGSGEKLRRLGGHGGRSPPEP